MVYEYEVVGSRQGLLCAQELLKEYNCFVECEGRCVCAPRCLSSCVLSTNAVGTEIVDEEYVTWK